MKSLIQVGLGLYLLATQNVYLYKRPMANYVPFYQGCNHGSPKYTKKYADNHQKSKRNRPYYGHRNHKYIIPKKNRV